jgi:hypothetical protein
MTLADKIASAEDALQKLMTGSLREEVRYENGSVRYAAADVEKLRGYIAALKSEAAGGSSRGAIGIVF